jgi:hypothetical protein
LVIRQLHIKIFIFNQKKRSGMKYYFVEQDICRDIKPMEAITKSYQYLSKQRYG